MEKFLKIEELKEKNLQEFQNELTKSMDKYKESVNNITDLNELQKEMEELDNILKDDKTYIDSVIYNLSDNTEFIAGPEKTETYKATKVFNDIIYFLNKNEVEWQYTLGLYQLVNLWKNTPKEISYGAYDSTLRMLQQVKFKGFDEWKNILIINNYLSTCHEAYTRDTNWLMYHNGLLNILMDREKLLQKADGNVDDTEAVQEAMQKDAEEEVNAVIGK